jgi:hypothetical protein
VSSEPLDRKEDGRAILGSLREHLGIYPTRYGNWEPLNRCFDPSTPDSALYSWKFPSFLWSTAEHRVGGQVGIGIYPYITLDSGPDEFRQDQLEALLVAWCRISNADFGWFAQAHGSRDLEGAQQLHREPGR